MSRKWMIMAVMVVFMVLSPLILPINLFDDMPTGSTSTLSYYAPPSSTPTATRASSSPAATPAATQTQEVSSPFPSDEELKELVTRAHKELKVFVYTIPDEILYYQASASEMTHCQPNLEAQGRDHFQHEHLIPAYFRNNHPTLTTNWEEADFLLVPHFFICIWLGLSRDRTLSPLNLERLLNWVHEQPGYKKNNGHDHLMVYMMDQGVFCEPYHLTDRFRDLTRNFTFIGNIGDMTDVPNCFRPGKDIVVPQYRPDLKISEEPLTVTRRYHTYFRGGIVPGITCSPHVREYLQEMSGLSLGNRYRFGSGEMADPYFGFMPAGWACWSARMYDAVAKLTIPVIMANSIVEPYERFLDWRSFSVKVNTDKVLPRQLEQGEAWFMDTIQEHIRSFEEMLARGGVIDPTNYVVRKRAAIRKVQPWLFWNPETTPFNAWGLMIVELWCRTPNGASHPRCQAPPSTLAFVQHW